MDAKMEQFVTDIVNRYDIDLDELIEMWEQVDAQFVEATCTHIFTKGDNRGAKCGKKAKKGDLCTRHFSSQEKKMFNSFHNRIKITYNDY